jgi:xylulokinase
LSGSGLFLELVRTELLGGAGIGALDAAAAATPLGADGLVALPWVAGRVMPRPAPHLRAAFIGLAVGHTRGHLWRAALEACAYALADAAADDPQGLELRAATAAGGGSRSSLWRAIVSDVTGWRQAVAPVGGTARGAALLAAHGIGGGAIGELARTWLAAAALDASRPTEPDPARHAAYRPLLERWRRLDHTVGEALAP